MTAQRRTNEAGARASAFEVEIETFWCDRIMRLAPGRSTEVWLTPNWVLMRWHAKGAVMVGVYTRAVELADFRSDAFFALEGK